MGLTGTERKKLCKAIISAYPSVPQLRMMVDYELDENLDAIALGENLNEIVFNLIQWAQSQGKLKELIDAAVRTNPGNPELRELFNEILDRIPDHNVDQNDIAKLRQSLQNGKFINNIGQITGGDVQFGDRTYYGTDAETIKVVIQDALPEIIQRIGYEKSPQTTTKDVDTTDSSTQLVTNAPPPKFTTFEFEVVNVDAQGKETQRCYKQAKCFTENLGAGTVLEMISIPGGNFPMGASEDEEASREDERPQHIVSIQSFCMGKYPITQAQWKFVANLPQIKRELELEPSCFKGQDLPVERVSWYDAQEFCLRLSRETRRNYRLPSEAQWEYASRARTSTPFYFGKTITTKLANYCGQDKKINNYIYKGTYSGELPGIYRQQTTEVGSFVPNNFGLYDMHGLVWEWCADWEHENYLDAPSDGSVWVDNGNEGYRILRGGSWDSFPNLCRCGSRFCGNPSVPKKDFGFRVICSGT